MKSTMYDNIDIVLFVIWTEFINDNVRIHLRNIRRRGDDARGRRSLNRSCHIRNHILLRSSCLPFLLFLYW